MLGFVGGTRGRGGEGGEGPHIFLLELQWGVRHRPGITGVSPGPRWGQLCVPVPRAGVVGRAPQQAGPSGRGPRLCTGHGCPAPHGLAPKPWGCRWWATSLASPFEKPSWRLQRYLRGGPRRHLLSGLVIARQIRFTSEDTEAGGGGPSKGRRLGGIWGVGRGPGRGGFWTPRSAALVVLVALGQRCPKAAAALRLQAGSGTWDPAPVCALP